MGSPINSAYINSLTAQVNAVNTCAELQAVTNAAISALNTVLAEAEAKLTSYTAIQFLLTVPTSPVEAVTWITNYINDYLTPQLAPYITLAAQVTQLTTAIAGLTTAIENKAATFTHCTITIP